MSPAQTTCAGLPAGKNTGGERLALPIVPQIKHQASAAQADASKA